MEYVIQNVTSLPASLTKAIATWALILGSIAMPQPEAAKPVPICSKMEFVMKAVTQKDVCLTVKIVEHLPSLASVTTTNTALTTTATGGVMRDATTLLVVGMVEIA